MSWFCVKEWVVLKEEETPRVGLAGGGGSHHSAGHRHLLLLSNTLLLSASPCPARLCSEQWDLDQDFQTDQEQRPEAGPEGPVFRLRDPVMLGTVKMEGHEAPDWSGYYSEEVGHCQPALWLRGSLQSSSAFDRALIILAPALDLV